MLRMDMTQVPMRVRESTVAEIREQNSLDFTKYLSCLAHTNGMAAAAADVFVKRFDRSYGAGQMQKWLETGTVNLAMKAMVAPGTTQDATWAKPLVGMESWAAGFLQIAHSQSLLGRIPGLQQIPFNTKVPYQTSDANFVWVAEATPVPTSKLAFSDGLVLGPTKVLGIVVLTEEFAKLSNAGTATAMRNALVSGLNAFVDRQFVDPTVAAVVGKNPASITNGTTPLVGTADVAASVKALIASFFAARPGAVAPVLLASGGHAAAIRGQVPGFGLEVIATDAVGTNIVMLDPAAVFFADGGLEINYSREAMLEMADPATSPVTAAVVFTSLYQSNLIGYRLTRFVSFGAAPNAVKYSTMP